MRYTAEFRGGDNGEKPWEWCVIDETQGLFGWPVAFDLTEFEARRLAIILNRKNKEEN